MGEVYKVSATDQLKVLYSFKAEGYRDGANPYTPVTADAAWQHLRHDPQW